MVFESPDSSGSSCQGGIYNAEEGACIPLPPYAIRSGPRRNIYFRPEQVQGTWHCSKLVKPSHSTAAADLDSKVYWDASGRQL